MYQRLAVLRRLTSVTIRRKTALGLNGFRFSIDWARLEPKPGQSAQAEMDHVIDVLKAARAKVLG